MKHLKYFRRAINEDLDTPQEVVYAESWVSSENEEADYNVTWKSESGEKVTAAFHDTGGPIIEDGQIGYSVFETVPGSSSDGKEYIGEVRYKETQPETFQIVSIIIKGK